MMIIRKAAEEDIGAIYEIEASCSSSPWSRGQFAEELYEDFAHLLVAEEDGEITGFADLHIVSDDAHINEIGVREDRRRRGTASLLMEEMLRLCAEKGCAQVSLEVRMSNVPAISLNGRYGFTAAGVRKRFYTRPEEDGITMTRTMAETETCLYWG